MNRIKTIWDILKNKRLDEYELILSLAIQHGYVVCSLRDYFRDINENKEFNKRYLVLRHDVDRRAHGTRIMFNIERKYGVKASYYFRHSTLDYEMMIEMEGCGFESSFHFETIADQVREKPWLSSHPKAIEESFPDLLERLRKDLSVIRERTGCPCVTIAAHGAPENRALGMPNNLLTRMAGSYGLLGIDVEAYDKSLLETISCYVSDSSVEVNDGYRYGLNPLDAIKRGEKTIMFLTHPEHWHLTPKRIGKKLAKVALYGVSKNLPG